jgi:hypothetical protein
VFGIREFVYGGFRRSPFHITVMQETGLLHYCTLAYGNQSEGVFCGECNEIACSSSYCGIGYMDLGNDAAGMATCEGD